MKKRSGIAALSEATRKRCFAALFLTPTLICFCLFYLYPILTVFITSFAKWDFSNVTNPQLYSINELFTNYKYIFTTYPFFWEALRNSLAWAALGAFVQIPISVAVALALSRQMRGWKFVRNVYIIPNIISSAAMSVIFLQLFNPRYGFFNQIVRIFIPGFSENILLMNGLNFWAITLDYIFFTGTTTILILGHIMAVPEEVYEAAMLDGASGFKRDFLITLPLIKDIIKTVSVLAVTSGFLLYNEVYFLTKGAAGTRSISYIIRELAIESPKTQYARANTVGVVQMLVGLLLIVIVNVLYSIPYGEIFNRFRRKHREQKK